MGVPAVIQAVQKFSEKTFPRACNVITVKKEVTEEEKGWVAEIEIVVEDEEMRRFARTPVIGLWEVHLDNRYNVASFERKGLREATSLEYGGKE